MQLDLTPGVLVAPEFARAVDTDGSETISASETAALVDLVTSTLELRVDGQVVPLAVTRQACPAYDLLAAAGGVVTVELTASLPSGSRNVVFTDEYNPGRTTVQMGVLVADADADPAPWPPSRTPTAGGRSRSRSRPPGRERQRLPIRRVRRRTPVT